MLTLLVPLKWVAYPEDQILKIGDNMNFECVAEGTPKPKIYFNRIVDDKSKCCLIRL